MLVIYLPTWHVGVWGSRDGVTMGLLLLIISEWGRYRGQPINYYCGVRVPCPRYRFHVFHVGSICDLVHGNIWQGRLISDDQKTCIYSVENLNNSKWFHISPISPWIISKYIYGFALKGGFLLIWRKRMDNLLYQFWWLGQNYGINLSLERVL